MKIHEEGRERKKKNRKWLLTPKRERERLTEQQASSLNFKAFFSENDDKGSISRIKRRTFKRKVELSCLNSDFNGSFFGFCSDKCLPNLFLSHLKQCDDIVTSPN